MGILRTLRWIGGVMIGLIGFALAMMCAVNLFGPQHLESPAYYAVMIPLSIGLLALAYVMTIYLDRRKRHAEVVEDTARLTDSGYSRNSLLLECVTKERKGDYILELLADKAVLHQPDGSPSLTMLPSEAEENIKLPGFARNRSTLGIRAVGETLEFRNPGAGLKLLSKWRDYALASSNPEFARRLRRRGMRDVIIGLAAIAAGVLLTVISYAAAMSGGTYYIFYGLAIVGLVPLVRGLGHIARHARMMKMLANEDGAQSEEGDKRE